MAVTLLDAVTSSNTGLLTTGVVSAGSNRWALYIPLFTSGSNAGGASSVTLGGQSMTLLAEADATDRDVAIQLWVLNEAGIAAMSGTTIVTTGGGSDDEGAYFLSIQDADQTLPAGANVNSDMYPSSSSGNLSLTRQADSWTFLAGLQDYEFSALSLGNPTHTNQITFKNGSGSVGYQADTANTSDCTFSGGASRDTGLVAANFVGAATGPEINTMDDPIRLGSTSAHTVSNFGSTINAGNVARDGIQLDGTSPSDTAITWAAQAQNLVTPSAGTGATVTLGDGTDTANATREFLPETGSTWNAVGTVSGSLVSGDWGFGLGLESSQDAYITRDSDSAIATHNDDGTTTWLDYGTSLVYSWDKNAVVGDDGGWTSITLTNSDGAPLLTLPTGTVTGQSTASGTVTTDTANGTLYYLASTNATELAATVKAGSLQAVTASGLQNVNVVGLAPGTLYYLHYVHTNASAQDSSVSNSTSFTTDSAEPGTASGSTKLNIGIGIGI